MGNARKSKLLRFLVVLLALFALTLLFWVNLQFVELNPGGNDFLPRWLGTRLFLTQGQNPYSQETTEAIQTHMYGRLAWESEDQALFAYPFYTAFIVAPFALIEDFTLARAVWIMVLEIALVSIAVISLQLTQWQPGRLALIIFLVFSIMWYHGAKPLIEGNIAILVTFFLVFALLLLKNHQDSMAGIFLAIATIKPQMVILLVPLILIWAVSHRRFRLIYSFIIFFGFLLLLSFVLQPQWLAANVLQISGYTSYVPPGTLAGIFSHWWPQGGAEWGWALSIFLLLLLIWEWWRAMSKPFIHLLWVIALTMVLSHFIGIPSTTSNFILMLPVFPLLFMAWSQKLNQQGDQLTILSLSAIFAALWILYTSTLLPGFQFRENLIMFFPVPIILIINLYWFRWWIINPQELSYPGKRLQEKQVNE